MAGNLLRANAKQIPLRDESVACVVSSPPYNVGIDYAGYSDEIPWQHYLELATRTAVEIERVLIPGGRVWLNVMPSVPLKDAAGKTYGPRLNLARLWMAAFHEADLAYRDTIMWQQDSFDGGTGWGSWLKPSAPNLRGSYEVIIHVYKPPYKRPCPSRWQGWEAARDELGGDWTDLTRNVWKMNPVRSSDSAPAPFPIELPARAIRLSTWPEEVVLDPFVGSGTTLRAAEALGRVGIGLDLGAL